MKPTKFLLEVFFQDGQYCLEELIVKKKKKEDSLYLKEVANVDSQCSRDGLHIHPLIAMLDLQPSHLVLQQHSQP